MDRPDTRPGISQMSAVQNNSEQQGRLPHKTPKTAREKRCERPVCENWRRLAHSRIVAVSDHYGRESALIAWGRGYLESRDLARCRYRGRVSSRCVLDRASAVFTEDLTYWEGRSWRLRRWRGQYFISLPLSSLIAVVSLLRSFLFACAA